MGEPIDLLSLVLTLRPLEALTDVPPLGRAAHALLLDAVRWSDPALAEQIHAGSEARPFTVSGLIGVQRAIGLTTNRTYALRLTALSASVAQALIKAMAPSAAFPRQMNDHLTEGGATPDPEDAPLTVGAQVHLAQAAFRVEAVDTGLDPAINPQSPTSSPHHPWAAAMTYETLSAQWLLGRATPGRSVGLQFTSPTTFKQGGRHLPVPLPGLVFGSLLEKWNDFAPVAFPPEVRRYAEECLAISQFNWQSRGVPLKEGGLRVGVVGQVCYTATSFDRYWLSLINVLAEFARFAGVGASTTMGLGQCRPISEFGGRRTAQAPTARSKEE